VVVERSWDANAAILFAAPLQKRMTEARKLVKMLYRIKLYGT